MTPDFLGITTDEYRLSLSNMWTSMFFIIAFTWVQVFGLGVWEGVRNFQARNYLRDEVKKGDLVLFYHSRIDPMAVAGIAEVVKEGYIDHYAFDPQSKYFDPKSKSDKPQWYMVDVKFKSKFKNPVTLKAIKTFKLSHS